LMASMVGSADGDVRLLDLGAGVGALTAAFVSWAFARERKPKSLDLTVWEAEGSFVRWTIRAGAAGMRWGGPVGRRAD
jgi:hypothetical protein